MYPLCHFSRTRHNYADSNYSGDITSGGGLASDFNFGTSRQTFRHQPHRLQTLVGVVQDGGGTAVGPSHISKKT